MNIKNALIYDSDDRVFRNGGLRIENGMITALSEDDGAIDFGGDILIPGLIDVHTHGRGGYDFITATVEELRTMKGLYASNGVTTVVPTLASAPLSDMLGAVGRIREAGFTAVHIEGRYLSPNRRGAHAADLLSELDPGEVALFRERARDMRLHFSAAYERDRAPYHGYGDGAFLKAVLSCGATAGLAHTDATFDEATGLVSNGVRSFTHLFNAMPPVHHRNGGAAMSGLLSGAYIEIICDGFHLSPETVRLVGRVKDDDQIVLITDSMEGTGCPDGEYSIAGSRVTLRGGRAYTEDGAIAGSTLELLDAVKNYSAFCGITFEGALAAATVNPARMMKLEKAGAILPGYRADLVRLGADHNIKEVYCGGVKVTDR